MIRIIVLKNYFLFVRFVRVGFLNVEVYTRGAAELACVVADRRSSAYFVNNSNGHGIDSGGSSRKILKTNAKRRETSREKKERKGATAAAHRRHRRSWAALGEVRACVVRACVRACV